MRIHKIPCAVCRRYFFPWLIRKIHQRDICLDCLNQALKKKAGPADAGARKSAPDTRPIESGPADIAPENSPVSLEDAEAANSFTDIRFLAIMLARIVFYLGVMPFLEKDGAAYAILEGIMLADLVSWMMVSLLKLPFLGVRFGIEFGIYVFILGFLFGYDIASFSDNIIVAMIFWIFTPLKLFFSVTQALDDIIPE